MSSYFFVDESGDPTFFDSNGNSLLQTNGCSSILIIGFIKTKNPTEIRRDISKLHLEISQDDYLKSIPSIAKTNIHFHAKDDCPEVREKVFRMIKNLDFQAEFVVAKKTADIFIKRHKRDENIFYNEIVSKLFEKNLHQQNNIIYFSKRGAKTKQNHISQAIQTAILTFEDLSKTQVETQTQTYIQIPSEEPCLQIIDYMNWAVYRKYTKNELRYFDFVKDKITSVLDIYDF